MPFRDFTKKMPLVESLVAPRYSHSPTKYHAKSIHQRGGTFRILSSIEDGTNEIGCGRYFR